MNNKTVKQRRKKIGRGYVPSGRGCSGRQNPLIYLIDGRLWVRDLDQWGLTYWGDRPGGEMKGYIPVNAFFLTGGRLRFFQCRLNNHRTESKEMIEVIIEKANV